MQIPFLKKSSGDKKTAQGTPLHWPGRAAIFLGAGIAVFILLAVLLAIDGYLFYIVRLRPIAPEEIGTKRQTLSGGDIDKVRNLLDRRAQELQEILGH